MKRLFLAALLLAAALGPNAAPSRAWRPFGEPSDGKVRPIQELNDANKPAEVIAALTPAYIQSLRGTDLRQAYVLMGDNLDRLGRTGEALGYYQVGVSLFPKNVDLLTRQAALLHRNGMDEQAKPLFLTALQYEPRHWSAHMGLAEIDRRLGFLDRAADHYEIALEAVDTRADVWRDYAQVLIALHEGATADLALRKALALDARSPDARILMAYARRQQGDLDGAADQLDAALDLGAGIGARRAKALVRLEAGRLDEARREAETVLKEAPGDGAALWVIARARLAAGDAAGAASDLASIKSSEGRNIFAASAARVLRDRILAR